MLEWIIVGGGIHGTYLANLLVLREGIPLDKVMIVDPLDSPCQRWKELTSRTGMKFLRSPIVHSVDSDPASLSSFMWKPGVLKWARTQGTNQRPSLRLFNAHIDHIVEKSGIYKAYRRAAVFNIREKASHMEVETTIGSIKAKRVILAISSNDIPRMPGWMLELKQTGSVIRNVFGDQFSPRHSISPSFSYAVVGSGLTAVQLSLSIAKKAPGKTTLITKGELDVNDLDFNPCWVGPKCLKPFAKISDYDERRRTVNGARNSGSVPRHVALALRKAIDAGQITLLTSRANSGQTESDKKTTLFLEDGRSVTVDRVIAAIGFEKSAPGSIWLPQVSDNLGLATHDGGYPTPDAYLRWHKRIFVTGALAELEIGAAARNIIGARLAGYRISNFINGKKPRKLPDWFYLQEKIA